MWCPWRSYLATCTGKVLCCRLDVCSCARHLCECFFGSMMRQNGPRAISKIMKWVPIVLCS